MLPKMKLDNSIFSTSKRKLFTSSGNDQILSIDNEHLLNEIAKVDDNAEKNKNHRSYKRLQSVRDLTDILNKAEDEKWKYIDVKPPVKANNVTRRIAAQIQKELLRAKTLEIFKFGSKKMYSKKERILNKQIILNVRRGPKEQEIDVGLLNEVDLSKYKKFAHYKSEFGL